MKDYTLAILLLMLTLPALGQARDSVLAVRHLFAQKRSSGEAWAATGAKVAVDESLGWRAIRSPAENTVAAVINGGVPLAAGLRQAQRFNAARETTVIQRYVQGMPIPPDVRRKLRRKHFRRTARDLANGW